MIAIMPKKILLLFLALMSMFGLAACDDDKAPTVPVEIPFDMGKIGQVVTQTFTVKEKEQLTYVIVLIFNYFKINDRKVTPEENTILNRILGVSGDKNEGHTNNGVPLIMRVTLKRVRDQAVIMEETTQNPKSSSYGNDARHISLGEAKLAADIYQIEVRYLSGASALTKFPAAISIARHGGK